jgi:hypothetical protein
MDTRLAFSVAAEIRAASKQVAELLQVLTEDSDEILQRYPRIVYEKLNRIAQKLQYEPLSIYLARWPSEDAPAEDHYKVLLERMEERLRGP